MTNVEENVPHPNSESGMAAEGAATHVFDVGAELGSRASRPKPVPHLTPAERAARGRATRGELPRSTHADWEPGPGRRDPVDLLEDQVETRLPELGPIRYGRMLTSPFTFFRGGAYAHLRPHAPAGPAQPPGELSVSACSPKGHRRRKRRGPHLDTAHGRAR